MEGKEITYYAQKMPSDGYWIWCKTGYREENFICSVNSKDKADTICEAFNIANKTGLTPSQLQLELEKAKELLKECSRFADSVQAPRTPAILLKQELTTFLEGSGNKTK